MRAAIAIGIGSIMVLTNDCAFGQRSATARAEAARPRAAASVKDMTGTIALTGPSSHFAAGQPQGEAQPTVPSLPPLPAPAGAIPRIIPLEPALGDHSAVGDAPQPKVIR